MNRQEQGKLKFDRRLRNRPGWVSEEEIDAELETLSDAAGNVAEDGGNQGDEKGIHRPLGCSGSWFPIRLSQGAAPPRRLVDLC